MNVTCLIHELRRFGALVLASCLDLVVPPFCAMCGPRVEADGLPALCKACVGSIESLAGVPTCEVCAAPMHPRLASRGRCPSCRSKRPPFARLIVAGNYRGKLQDVIAAMKYGDQPALARPVGALVMHALEHARPVVERERIDRVVPVPLTRRRLRERGFNQAELIARAVADWTESPLGEHDLVRRDERSPQARLSASARKTLSAGVFEARHAVWGRRVVLVDDVVTTGTTIRMATRALKAGGAREVIVVAAARTPLGDAG